MAQLLDALLFQSADLFVEHLHAFELAAQALVQLRVDLDEPPAVPGGQLVEHIKQILVHRDYQPAASEQALDTVDAAGAVVLQLDQFAVQLASLLVGFGRHTHDAPDLRLALVVADEHGQQLVHVPPVGLGPLGPTVDLDAG